MKHLLTLLTILCLACFIQSCNLSRTAVVKDTVKSVVTTTADYYKFYHPAYGEGRLKDYYGTIKDNQEHPELPIRIVPAPEKHDSGYFIVKPAAPVNSNSLKPGDNSAPGELVLKQGEFRPITIPQRGN